MREDCAASLAVPLLMEYLACGCASDAYRAAYEAGQISHGAIQVEASWLLDNPKVAAAIDEHRAALAKTARHSLQDCIAHQERAMVLAEASRTRPSCSATLRTRSSSELAHHP